MDDAGPQGSSEQIWSVFEFARRYRLAKREENRLLMLYGRLHRCAIFSPMRNVIR
ncbi:hypothetical protein AMJ97_PB00013 (plasmid) [Rhizobium sp. N1314]|nr:hypothetical protein AMK02_PB00013 [Rhizobium sp. N731]ANL18187.1 hypothetical protein AMJ97_PB00013 [Rhizobium sp. N1314]